MKRPMPSLHPANSARKAAATTVPGSPRLPALDAVLVPLLYFVIVIAAFNTVLRSEIESSITLYYAAAPILLVILLLTTTWFFRWIVAFVIAAIYGVLVARWFGTPQEFYVPKLLFLLFLLTFFGVMRFLHLRDPNFTENILRTLWGLTLAVFALAIIQSITGFRLPNVDPADYGYLTAYFFTPNDVALFVSAGLTLVLMRRGPFQLKAALFTGVLILNTVNDARAALMAMAIIPVVFYVSKSASMFRSPPLVVAGLAGIGLAALIFGGSAIEFQVGAVRLNFYELLAEPIRRIVQLDDYNLRGSLYDRSDALIISIREFIGTLGFGLGPGGSTYLLSLPEHKLVTAESLHNAMAEFAVEFGVLFLVPLGIWVVRLGSKMMSPEPSRGDMARFAFLCGLPFLGATQSSGFISNYAFWMILYLVMFMPDVFWSREPQRFEHRGQQKPNIPVMPWERSRSLH